MKCKNCIKIALIMGYGTLPLYCNAESEQQRYLNSLASMQDEEKREIPCNRFCSDNTISEIIIPMGIPSIGDGAFVRCENLKNITISDSVIFIGNIVFSECRKLTSITIPKSVKRIGDGAFAECINLLSVVILNSEISIGVDVFFGCEKLSQITLPAEFVKNFLQKLEDYGLENVWGICEKKDGMVVLVRKMKY